MSTGGITGLSIFYSDGLQCRCGVYSATFKNNLQSDVIPRFMDRPSVCFLATLRHSHKKSGFGIRQSPTLSQSLTALTRTKNKKKKEETSKNGRTFSHSSQSLHTGKIGENVVRHEASGDLRGSFPTKMLYFTPG